MDNEYYVWEIKLIARLRELHMSSNRLYTLLPDFQPSHLFHLSSSQFTRAQPFLLLEFKSLKFVDAESLKSILNQRHLFKNEGREKR